jgi:hypothetical protein
VRCGAAEQPADEITNKGRSAPHAPAAPQPFLAGAGAADEPKIRLEFGPTAAAHPNFVYLLQNVGRAPPTQYIPIVISFQSGLNITERYILRATHRQTATGPLIRKYISSARL